MSESDSENDYESADEADEVITKNKITGVQNPPTSVADPPIILPPVEQDGVTEPTVEDSNKGHSSDMGAGDSTCTSNSDISSLKKDIQFVSIDRENSSKATVATTTASAPVIDTQPKRVPLRLEKKIQQQAQTASEVSDDILLQEQSQPQATAEEKSSTWGFSSWGSSLLSTAASSVSTFTSQVSQGIGTVIETVETSLGAPAPEDLASILKERREAEENPAQEVPTSEDRPKEAAVDQQDNSPSSALFTGVSSLTKVIETTGSKVLMGGLDTLELIGKKTMDILTEGDPGLRVKRSVFSSAVNLSQLLREAKERAEKEQANVSETGEEETVYFSTFFDEFQGLVHLEALEMLSSQCQNKIQGALMVANADSSLKEDLSQLKKICEDLPSPDETPDDKTQDFDQSIEQHRKYLQIDADLKKLIKVRNNAHDWLDKCIAEQEKGQTKEAKKLYHEAIRCLAEFTASCMEHFHKFGELVLVQCDPDFSSLLCATHLTGLTSVLSVEVSIIASKFSQSLNTAADDSEDPDSIMPLITTVFLEASNSTTYIQDAFQLLVPVLQAAILE